MINYGQICSIASVIFARKITESNWESQSEYLIHNSLYILYISRGLPSSKTWWGLASWLNIQTVMLQNKYLRICLCLLRNYFSQNWGKMEIAYLDYKEWSYILRDLRKRKEKYYVQSCLFFYCGSVSLHLIDLIISTLTFQYVINQ